MHVTCPCCQSAFPIEAGFADADGKRLAALFADLEPALGRAVIGYLRLFKPGKQSLRTGRAVRLVADLVQLINAGDICRDERAGVRRKSTPAMWAEGIEQMLTTSATSAKLILPLANHNYLRTIVFGLADSADAATERQREELVRSGTHRNPPPPSSPTTTPHKKLYDEIAWLHSMRDYGQITQAELDAKMADLKNRIKGSDNPKK